MPKKIVGILTEHLVENIDEACLGIDRDGRIHFINRAACRLFEVNVEQVTGQKIWDALQMNDFTRAFVRFVKSGEGGGREQMIVMPDQRALHAQFQSVRPGEGRVVGAVAVLRDVTSVMRIENDVVTLVARISEEVKVPLTSIKGYVETLLEGAYTEPAVLRRFLQIINDETNRLARLLVGLMEAGGSRTPAEAPLGVVALGPLVRDVASNLSPLAQQKGLVLEIDISGAVPPVRANEALLRQAVTNLLDNAIKFCGVRTQDEGSEAGWVRVLARTSPEGVRLEVSDNGIGIPESEQERIFERFYRVTAGPAGQLGGTGLGLSIARENITGCGGRLEVHSTPGHGAAFIVTLPRCT